MYSCTIVTSKPTKQHTGSIHGHNHLMDVLAMLARASIIGPVRVNHKVSTTGDGTCKQGEVEIQNFPLLLCDSLVIDISFVCESGSSRAQTGSSRALGGWNNGVRRTNDVLKARSTVKNNQHSEAYGLVKKKYECACCVSKTITTIYPHKAFAPAIVSMSG